MTESQPPRNRILPNPLIAVPVLIAAGVGWFVGSSVARVSCRPDGCLGQEILWGTAGALVGFVGVLVISVLAVRSLAEWSALSAEERHKRQHPEDPPSC